VSLVARVRRGLLAAVLALALAAPATAGAETLTCSVAISMKEAVEALGRRFMAAQPDVALRYNFGASGALARQIEAGAPVDVFVSAAQQQMDDLERGGLLLPGTRRVFARNVLTVVAPADAAFVPARPADLLDARLRRVVIGNPRTVPVGRYAEQSLRALGLWDRLHDRLVLAENVRQVLDYVARGEADAGFVYVTDVAVAHGRVREAFRPAPGTYPPVTYPAAVLHDTRHARAARAFVDLLAGDDARAVLARFGFQPPL
jgi:molybdate transport system substrate-binding protein